MLKEAFFCFSKNRKAKKNRKNGAYNTGRKHMDADKSAKGKRPAAAMIYFTFEVYSWSVSKKI